jgi:probable HAF family extracellular repeat protein
MCFFAIQRSLSTVRLAGFSLVLAGALIVSASAQGRYKIVSVPTPAGYDSAALGLNDNGNVVGYNVQGDTYQAFLYSQSSGSSIDVGSLGGRMNAACAINGSDQVAGYSQDANGNLGAFIYTKDGGIKALGSLDGGVSSEAFGINNSGQAVGDSQNATDDHKPVLFDNSGAKDLNVSVAQNSNGFRTAYAINDAGQIGGRTDTEQGAIHAFLLTSSNGDVKDIGTLGGTNSEALAINKSGEVVGDAETSNGTPHAFIYRKGSTRDLGTLAGFDTVSFARSINDQGEVVGDSESSDQKRAFVYSNGQMSELDKLATNLGDSGFASLDVAYGINNRGWIAGYGTATDGRTIAFLAVPEGQGVSPLAQAQPQAPQAEAQSQSEGTGDDYSVFYSRLSSDGDWVEAGDYGYCFKPHVAQGDWAPYQDGHWVWTDRGWFWYSNENFGWATYHYGRWVRISGQGWCWVPGNEWAPAWVSWRQSSEYAGWAPLPPEAGFSVNVGVSGWADNYYGIGPAAYTFINFKSWSQPSYVRYIAPPNENVQIIRQTTNITNIRVQNTVINNFGPRVETVQQSLNQKIVPTKIVFNPNRQAGYGANIRGSELQVVAPAEKLRAVSSVQPQVKTRLAKAEVDNGWKNVNPAEQAELRKKFAEQNPPPKEQPPKQALVKPTFVHETKNVNPPPGTGPQHPQATGVRAVPPAQTGTAAQAAKRPETGGAKGWNTMPPNLIGSRSAGGEHFQKTLPNRGTANSAITPKNEEQRLRGKGQPSATAFSPGQPERKETPAPAGGIPTPKNEEPRREKAGQNPTPGNEINGGKPITRGAEEKTKEERAPKGATTPKVETPKPEEAVKPEASPKGGESMRKGGTEPKADFSPKPEASPRNESIRREAGGPKSENPPKQEPKGESPKKEEGAPKVVNPPKEERAPKNEPAVKKEDAAPKQNPPKEERAPKNEPPKKEEAAPKENKPKEEGQPKGEPVKKEEGAQKPENKENRAPAPQGQKPEGEKEKGKGKEKGSPAP